MIKLAKLPDRTPVKHGFSATPELNRKLIDYAAFYLEAYGEKAEIADLIPAMLESHLDGDKAFVKWRKSAEAGT